MEVVGPGAGNNGEQEFPLPITPDGIPYLNKVDPIQICTTKDCGISVTDILSIDMSDFFENEVVYSIDVLETHRDGVLPQVLIRQGFNNSNVFPTQKDGWYTIHHFTLPDEPWDWVDPDKDFYFYMNEKFYKMRNDEITEVDINEIITRNPTNSNLEQFKLTKDYFTMCLLKKCYLELLQKIMNDKAFNNCFEYTGSQVEINKRDLLFMTVETISLLISKGDYKEAQRIIDKIHGCNGLCKHTVSLSSTSNCGCTQ